MMSMIETIGKGDFMPAEFWVALSMLFGTAFVSMLIWIVNRFLVKLDTTIDWLKTTVRRLEDTDRIQADLLKQHDKDIQDLKRRKR